MFRSVHLIKRQLSVRDGIMLNREPQVALLTSLNSVKQIGSTG